MPQRTCRGFTLIELLVVMAIIGLLASIVFPVTFRAVAASRRSACSQNMMQISQAVVLARLEGLGYPAMPNFVGAGGIPQGGITGLALNERDAKLTGDFWCREDTYPLDISGASQTGTARDATASSYEDGYNYYGYVTTTDGMPFPITTKETFVYFNGRPGAIDPTIPFDPTNSNEPNWDLGVVKPDSYVLETPDPSDANITLYNINNKNITWDADDHITKCDVRPAGLFQGLVNTWAPQETLITFCPHHIATNGQGTLIAVTVNGEIIEVHPPHPRFSNGLDVRSACVFPRANGGAPNMIPAIDWRINKAPYGADMIATKNRFGVSKGSAYLKNMPIVQVFHRVLDASRFRTSNWYDTGLDVQPGTVIMVSARGKWTFATGGLTDPGYDAYRASNGALFFTPSGDPLYSYKDAMNDTTPLSSRNANNPPGTLVGCIGNASPFSLASRGSHIATAKAGESGALKLSMNLPNGWDYSSSEGWSAIDIALFHP
ncbi:MAG TPA: type II secretion system protein [Armatimonadota bacterium]|jgi:prepilin-type N-terminal cleavage/methylation domain-containing protein